MTKILVETTGDFMFTDVGANQVVQPHRPSVVVSTAFIKMKIAEKKIKVLDDDLPDSETDEKFEKEWEARQGKPSEPAPPKRSENKIPVQGKKEKDEDFAKRLEAWKVENPEVAE